MNLKKMTTYSTYNKLRRYFRGLTIKEIIGHDLDRLQYQENNYSAVFHPIVYQQNSVRLSTNVVMEEIELEFDMPKI